MFKKFEMVQNIRKINLFSKFMLKDVMKRCNEQMKIH